MRRTGPPLIYVPDATLFWRMYQDIAASEFPQLQLGTQEGRGKRFVRVAFHGAGRGRALVHQLRDGYVDLQLYGQKAQVEALREANVDLIGDDVEVVEAADSAAFRMHVPPLDWSVLEDAPEERIREALRAARRLHALRNQIRA